MAGKKKKQPSGSIQNRRARFDYVLSDNLTVGMELTGRETKALRMGHGQLRGAYVTAKDNQLWLVNATISGTTGIPIDDTEKIRTRRLLARRREIDELISAKHQGRTIVPTEILTRGRYIKLRIALGKGKKLYDKRRAIQERETSRRIRTELTGA